MLGRERGWMKLAACLMLTLPVSGCVRGASDSAICDGTASSRTDHAAALAADGGNLSVMTGAKLISQIDAACAMMQQRTSRRG